MSDIILSPLNHTWFIDLDGTLVKHNGYLMDGNDTLLNGAKSFLDNIPDADYIIITTSRTEEYKERTIEFLNQQKIRYNQIIFGLPYGERILINDDKPSGLKMSKAICLSRDNFDIEKIIIDKSL